MRRVTLIVISTEGVAEAEKSPGRGKEKKMENNFCDRCKTTIDAGQAHCPLCGRCVNDNVIDKHEKYPNYKSFARSYFHIAGLLMRILLVLTSVAIIANLILDINNLWCLYVFSGAVAIHLAVLVPIRYKINFALQMKFMTLGISQLIITIEIMTHTFGWGVGYVIPLILLAQMIVCAIFAICKGYINFEYIRPTLFLLVCSLIIFVLDCYVFKVVQWPSVSAFLLCFACFGIILLLRYKRTIKSIKKYYKF